MTETMESQQLLSRRGQLSTALPTTVEGSEQGPQIIQHTPQGTQRDNGRRSIIPSHTQISRNPLSPTATPYQAPLRWKHLIASILGTGWTWEYLALVVSASTLTALVVVLVYIDELGLSRWKSPVSPTATVFILAAISRVSLGFAVSSCIGQAKWNWLRKRSDKLLAFAKFDHASRGPWGSFWLIVWVKASHMVAIGAVVTIMLSAFEPSLQAVVSIEGGEAPSNAGLTVRLGRSEFLDVGT
ncbi:hypothetical protein O1611_g1475 [Lasiodiplodia mahajangana]|uniref:Uncharacterized protein n=1 Tax=Lasiodiplodia mahajangana TaxID=1108764 RepID=A0ACC2JXA3_9PEZI|nr:hypothetical protein O1611_g1475 [Lasiodiplodia mahajangana]